MSVAEFDSRLADENTILAQRLALLEAKFRERE